MCRDLSRRYLFGVLSLIYGVDTENHHAFTRGPDELDMSTGGEKQGACAERERCIFNPGHLETMCMSRAAICMVSEAAVAFAYWSVSERHSGTFIAVHDVETGGAHQGGGRR